MTPTNADVTAVVACFNYGRFVGEAVESLVSQEGGAPHVIVVDDGSTDGTRELLTGREWPGSVTVLRHTRNRGKGAAVRTALGHARGTY
ncbi:MAG: glycosyltransferase family 2 protein, partial [Gammaproteobacteria bacterium]